MMMKNQERSDRRGMQLSWEGRNAYKSLMGKGEVKRHFGRPRRRYGDNMKKDLEEIL
jgi:hypothetical protein